MENQQPTNGVRSRPVVSKQGAKNEGQQQNLENNYDGDKRKIGDSSPLLGPFHWIGIIIYMSLIYFLCIRLDARLPTPLNSKSAGDHRFSEERSRKHLNALAAIGPRPSGSDAAEILARNYLLTEIEKIRSELDEKVFRMDIDVQKPSGCFGLIFLSNFTLCYKNLTNIVVRLGKKEPSSHSLLLNCHFDSVAQSPGATDDAISCAIMLELLNVFSKLDPKKLPYDLIFLFNGAEENFLQASHGFITTHPWRHTIRAFINLEGCGAGGREMLFQAGPANVWLLHAYLNSAPYPHCSIMAQEIFQSGLVPADTDFRIFRDFGRMPGMDIAYIKNGYVYHTEFDRPEFVAPGAMQRGGDNLFATVSSIIRSPCFTRPCPQQETKLVYFDFVGQFVVQYPATYGTLLNYVVVVAIIVRILRQIQKSNSSSDLDVGYSMGDASRALLIHVTTIVSMASTTFLMIRTTIALDLTMAWYSWRPMVLFIYVIPTLIIGLMMHALWNLYLLPPSSKKVGQEALFRLERVNFDMALFIFAVIVFALTWKGLGSAYYALIHALFPLMRDVLLWIYEKVFGKRRITALTLLIAHAIALFPVVVVATYCMISVLEFFIPIMGRAGPMVNPEVVIGIAGTTCSVVIVLYVAGLVYISRGFGEVLKFASCLTLLMIAVAAFTDFGAPYVYDSQSPRLRRLHIQHVSRTIYGPDGRLSSSDNGLLLAAMDYRGVQDLPPTAFLQGSGPPPCIREDAYCGLPYYVSVKDMFPPERNLWMPVPGAPNFETPVSIKMTSKERVADGIVKMNFSVTGYDHMTLFLTPLNNWTLDSWSLTSQVWDRTQTYFVFLAYVGRDIGPWEFSLTFKKSSTKTKAIDDDEGKLLLGVASHYLHGKNQYSQQTKALIDSIRERRSKPPTATLGYWKWFMTPDAHNSEYVAKYFK